MKHRKQRNSDGYEPFYIEIVTDVGAGALGVGDGFQFDAEPSSGRRKWIRGKEDRSGGFTFQCRERTETAHGVPEGSCVCSVSAQRKTSEWEHLSRSDYFRYSDAVAAGYLAQVKEKTGIDLAPHIIRITVETPLTFALRGEGTGTLLAAAQRMFPERQEMRVAGIEESDGQKLIRVEKTDGFSAAFFRAGQYVLVSAAGTDAPPARFLLCSSPALSKDGCYLLTPMACQKEARQLAADWQPGMTVEVSSPLGRFYFNSLRDRSTVIGIADAEGTAALLSMAGAIRDGLEKFKLTVILLDQEESSGLLLRRLEAICAECGKVRLIRLPAGGTAEALSDESFRKHLPHEAYSVFLCGTKAFCDAAEQALAPLKLPRRIIRRAVCEEADRQKELLLP